MPGAAPQSSALRRATTLNDLTATSTHDDTLGQKAHDGLRTGTAAFMRAAVGDRENRGG